MTSSTHARASSGAATATTVATSATAPARPFARGRHNHERCVSEALSLAESLCASRGLRLTPSRRRVLELVWASHEPIGAYEILAGLARDGRSAAPPTVYRALEFLLQAGLVHRVDSLNAYVGCEHPDAAHGAQFLVCRKCQRVAELNDPAIGRVLAERTRVLGFEVGADSIEIKGLCPSCHE